MHRLPPLPPGTHTRKHTCCLSVRISYLVTGADAGFQREGGGFHMNNCMTKELERDARFAHEVVRVLIFPRIVLETKAISTNK